MSLKEFDAHFEPVLESLYQELPSHLQEVIIYLQTMVKYNVPHGKKNRGLTVVHAVNLLKGKENGELDSELLKMAIVAGWAIEWMQASFLVHDDIMDQSYTRRGRPCWYLEASRVAGLTQDSLTPPTLSSIVATENPSSCPFLAVNDGIHLLLSCLQLLRLHCSTLPKYGELVQLFLNMAHRTSLGQAVDCLTPACDVATRYSESRYRTLVQWKTAYYSFCLPVMAAIILTNLECSPTESETIERILLKIGEVFQAQDDYLDVYGDASLTGKIGTDIADGKCSWLIVKAMQLANPQQQEILWANYGKEGSKHCDLVKQIFDELHIPSVYKEFESETFTSLLSDIDRGDLQCKMKETLHHVINTIFRREK